MNAEPFDPPEPRSPARVARAVGVAFDLKKLLLAALGLILTWAGWGLLDRAFGDPDAASAAWAGLADAPPPGWADWLGPLGGLAWALSEPARVISAPFRRLFDPSGSAASAGHALLAAAWAAAVWGIVGGAIGPIAVVQAATVERVGLVSALRFALRRWVALVVAPLCPLLGVALLAMPAALLGLLYRLPDPAPTIAGALAFVPLLLGLAMAVLLLGLAVGWPLMHLTVAAEGEDLFDALSRSYSYVNQRLMPLAACLGVAAAAGLVGRWLVGLLGRLVVDLAAWGLSIGGPALVHLGGPDSPATGTHAAWLGAVEYLVRGWSYAYLWSAAAIIYLVLRRDVDGTPWHAIYFEAHDADAFAPDPEPPPATSSSPEAGGPPT